MSCSGSRQDFRTMAIETLGELRYVASAVYTSRGGKLTVGAI